MDNQHKEDILQRLMDVTESQTANDLTEEELEALLNEEGVSDVLDDMALLEEAATSKWGEDPDVNAAWQKYCEKNSISEQSSAEETENVVMEVSNVRRNRFLAIAASVAVLIVAGAFYYFHYIDNNKVYKSAKQLAAVTVTSSEGDRMITADSMVCAKAESNDNQTITVPRGKMFTVTLSDGTRVQLNAGSRLTYPSRFDGKERQVSLEGEAYFDVTHDESHPFIVNAGKMTTRVLGTQFDVCNYRNRTPHVTLVQGSVEVTVNGTTRRIQPGQDAAVDNADISVRSVNTEDITCWRDGLIFMDNGSLKEILLALGDWYNVDIECRNRVLLSKHFHFVCSREDSLKEALRMLNESSDLNVCLENGDIVVK